MNTKQVGALVDKLEVIDAVNSYFHALDEKQFDIQHLSRIFTDDAQVVRPNGLAVVGPQDIGASHEKSFARFESTQHLLTGHETQIEGDMASVRVNVIAMHMWAGGNQDARRQETFFVAGGVITARLCRIDDSWRISSVENAVKWRAGDFKNMAQTGK
jgi:ketosteroid isomerase-like protein